MCYLSPGVIFSEDYIQSHSELVRVSDSRIGCDITVRVFTPEPEIYGHKLGDGTVLPNFSVFYNRCRKSNPEVGVFIERGVIDQNETEEYAHREAIAALVRELSLALAYNRGASDEEQQSILDNEIEASKLMCLSVVDTNLPSEPANREATDD